MTVDYIRISNLCMEKKQVNGKWHPWRKCLWHTFVNVLLIVDPAHSHTGTNLPSRGTWALKQWEKVQVNKGRGCRRFCWRLEYALTPASICSSAHQRASSPGAGESECPGLPGATQAWTWCLPVEFQTGAGWIHPCWCRHPMEHWHSNIPGLR